MPLFATLSTRRPPRGLLQHRRGTQSCRYLRHLRHLAFSHATHGFPRAPNPVHIYDTFYTSAWGIAFLEFCALRILCIFATLSLGEGFGISLGITVWEVFCLGAVSSVASFTRFRKFARGGCNAYQLRVGSHARVYFSKKNNIEKGLTPTPFTSSLHVSHAGSI